MDWFRQFLSNEFLRYFFSSFSFFLIKRFTNLNRSEQRFKHCQTPFLSPIFSNVQIQITFSREKSSICIISSRMTRSTIRELMNGRELKIRVHRASASDRNIERNYQWNIGNWRKRRRKRKEIERWRRYISYTGWGNLSLGYNVTRANHIAIRGAIWPQYWRTSRFPLWLSSTSNVTALIVHTGCRMYNIGFALETAPADRLIANIRGWFRADLVSRMDPLVARLRDSTRENFEKFALVSTRNLQIYAKCETNSFRNCVVTRLLGIDLRQTCSNQGKHAQTLYQFHRVIIQATRSELILLTLITNRLFHANTDLKPVQTTLNPSI